MYSHKNRVLWLYLLFTMAFLAFLGRIFYIQLWQGASYTKLAVAQRQKTINYLEVPRGNIYDRHLQPLTNVTEEPCLVVFPTMVKDLVNTANHLAEILKISPQLIVSKINYPSSKAATLAKSPFVLKNNLSQREKTLLSRANLPGIYVLPLVPRYQSHGPAGHLIGTLGEMSAEEYHEKSSSGKDYHLSDLVGKSGWEKQYEDYLKGGSSPKIAVMVDVYGHHPPGAGFTILPAKQNQTNAPYNLLTTLDLDYQNISQEALGDNHGAVVIMDIWQGEILALASSPKFDPDMSKTPASGDAYLNKALINFPPASIFKILIAAAALEEGLAQSEDVYSCSGGLTLPSGQNVACWQKGGHGEISLAQALAYSCNPVFVSLGLRLGGEKIHSYMKKLGLMDDTIIGYQVNSGKHLDFNPAVPGDMANVSLGEKGVSLSPLLVAKLLAQIANGGISITPQVVFGLQDNKGETCKELASPKPRRILKSKTAASLKNMLKLAVEEGTGKSAQVPGVGVAGKTGSSETGAVWFAGFAPVENPRWSIVVFLQKGTAGGREAALIFQKILTSLAKEEG